jgi:dTDP-4-dehydrorhamnose reductase
VHETSILLFGRNGQLGRALQAALSDIGPVTALGRADADFSRPEQVRSVVQDREPKMIVNAAAFTDVDGAESDKETAHLVNAVAPGVLAEEAERIGAGIVHYSTDYVFDGRAERPYTEAAATDPRTVYGKTKREGERRIQSGAAPFWIFRTSWLYGPTGDNFLRTMLRLGRERDRLQVVDDQFGSPTSTLWLADATRHVIQCVLGSIDMGRTSGIYHSVSRGQTSWYGFAQAIFRVFDVDVEVEPVDTSAFPRPASRPAYSVLDPSKLMRTFGLQPPSWSRQLADIRKPLLEAER